MVSGLLAGATGGATVAIVIKAVDQFSKTFTAAQKSMAQVGVAMTAIGIAGAVAIGGLVKMAGQFEQTQIAFTTMLGSAELANKLLKDLADFASKTPFTIPGIEQNAKMLLAMSIPLEDLLPTLKSLGDIASGLNVPMERLALNFGQVKVQGKLTGRELRDFAVAGVPLVAELAKNLNKAESEIKDMVSAGDIGFKEVEDAFKTMTGEGGKFFDLMDAQSQTLLGQISNIQDSFIKLGRVMGAEFLPAAKKVAEKVAELVGWFERHPTIAKWTAITLAAGTALALIIGPILIMLALLPAMIAGFGTLTAVTLPMTLTILAITAGIVLLIAAWVALAKFWDEMGPKTKIFLALLAPFIVIPVAIIKEWDKIKIGMAIVWNSIVKSIGWGVNFAIGAINKLIGAWNIWRRARGKSTVGSIGKLDVSGALIDIEAMKKTTEEIVKQVDETKKLSKEQKLVNQLAGFKVIQKTGDVFNPNSFQKKDFESNFAYEQAKRGAGFTINIENINGLDPEEISRALSDELGDKLSL